MSVSSVTRLFAPTIARSPTVERSRTVALIPTRARSSTVELWTIAVWPTVAYGPISAPSWRTALSWTFAPSRSVMLPWSPRNVTFGQTLASASMVTSPMTTAAGST
jgi:hypothetical protein